MSSKQLVLATLSLLVFFIHAQITNTNCTAWDCYNQNVDANGGIRPTPIPKTNTVKPVSTIGNIYWKKTPTASNLTARRYQYKFDAFSTNSSIGFGSGCSVFCGPQSFPNYDSTLGIFVCLRNSAIWPAGKLSVLNTPYTASCVPTVALNGGGYCPYAISNLNNLIPNGCNQNSLANSNYKNLDCCYDNANSISTVADTDLFINTNWDNNVYPAWLYNTYTI